MAGRSTDDRFREALTAVRSTGMGHKAADRMARGAQISAVPASGPSSSHQSRSPPRRSRIGVRPGGGTIRANRVRAAALTDGSGLSGAGLVFHGAATMIRPVMCG